MTLSLMELCRMPAPGTPGPNLEYTPEFLALEAMLRPAPEAGIVITDGKEAPAAPAGDDLADAQRRAMSLMVRSRDVRLAGLYAAASVRRGDLAGYRGALEYVYACLACADDGVHPLPEVDEDDCHDRTAFWSAVGTLFDPEGIGAAFEPAALLSAIEAETARARADGEDAEADPNPHADALHEVHEALVGLLRLVHLIQGVAGGTGHEEPIERMAARIEEGRETLSGLLRYWSRASAARHPLLDG